MTNGFSNFVVTSPGRHATAHSPSPTIPATSSISSASGAADPGAMAATA